MSRGLALSVAVAVVMGGIGFMVGNHFLGLAHLCIPGSGVLSPSLPVPGCLKSSVTK